MDPSETTSDCSTEPLTGYELIADLMRRQDQVIGEIDDLNERIEAAIREISAQRKTELGDPVTESDDPAGHPADLESTIRAA